MKVQADEGTDEDLFLLDEQRVAHHTTSFRDGSKEIWYRRYFLVPFINMLLRLQKHWMLIVFVVVAIISQVGSGVYLKILGEKMPDFSYFIFWFTAVWFVPPFFIWMIIVLLTTKQITPEMRRIPQYKFIIVGVLIMLNGVFILFSNPHVPGLMQALLGPSVVTIPIAMGFSFLLLKRRYSLWQCLAVLIVILGLMVAVAPSIVSSFSTCDTSTDASCSDSDTSTFGSIGWNAMFLAGSFPIAIAGVYEEKAMEHEEIHMSWLLFFSTLYQTLSIIAVFPIDAIPDFGTTSWNTLFSHQWYGFLCFLGQDIPDDACPSGCNCEWAWVYTIVFVLCFEISTMAVLGVVKYGNATFSFVIQAAVLPLSVIAFGTEFIMGQYVEAIEWEVWVSTVILIFGIVVYRLTDVEANEVDPAVGVERDATMTATLGRGDFEGEDDGQQDVVTLGTSAGALYGNSMPYMYRKTKTIDLQKLRSGDFQEDFFTM